MPNHWESSARPLFVKTVFVNGNRHAILSQEDPLLHSNPSWLKKQSRPNSSLSLASTLSTSSTETQDSDSNIRIKSSKRHSVRERRGKDISSELQGCLIKLRIASSLQKSKKESAEEGMFYNSLEEMKWTPNESPNENSTQKRKKWNHDKNNKKKHCERNHIKSARDNNLTEITNESDNCCYVYNLENNRGKKNYCFVKISSKPSHLILKCSCERTWSSNPNFCTSKEFAQEDKNKMALSATFHNFIMTTDSDEKSKKYSSDYLLTLFNSDPCELYWNSYLARSFYNSLSERVIQWIDLKSKRKKIIEKTDSKPEDNSTDKIERIFVGKTFLGQGNKPETTHETGNRIQGDIENKTKREKENVRKVEKSEEDVEGEVKVEDNIETALSVQKFENQCFEEPQENSRAEAIRKDLEKNQINRDKREETTNPMTSIPHKFDSNSYMSNYLQDSIADRLNTSVSSLTKPCIAVQEIMLDDDPTGKFYGFSGGLNKKKTLREKRNSLKRQKKIFEGYNYDDDGDDNDEDDSDEDKEFRVTAIKCWEKGLVTSKSKRNTSGNNFQIYRETTSCICNRSGEDNAKPCKNLNLTQQHSEKTPRSIDNQNITRSTLCQNLLSPQQHQEQQFPRKIPWSEDGKNSWVTEKNLGRPQLHIFMPPIPSSDPSEESMSECESFLSEVF